MKRKIVVVDDIPSVKDFMVDVLNADYNVVGVTTAQDALVEVGKGDVDLLITDIKMPDMNGEQLIEHVRAQAPHLPILTVTAYGSIENATQLMRLGAYDYLEKPFSVDKLRHTIDRALQFKSIAQENRALHARLGNDDRTKVMVGNSIALQNIREKVKLVAPTAATILITGESGTGKEVVAHEIHRLSRRAGKPFKAINCASIPSTLLENELFGHEKGAYTGAIKTEPGKFEQADGGTILLDEIGEMEHTIQAKLLRVIQEGEFDRVGGSKPIKVDVRIIATTNRNLKDEIRKGRFREDLFYRLNVVPMEMPALRERRDDVPLLINHFNDLFSTKNNTDPVKFTEAAVRKLSNAYWKGNVRQLQNVVERAVILRSGMTLDEDYFEFENEREEQLSKVEHAFRYGSVREMEKLMILNRLTENKNNRTRSAETLEISVRTLRNKLNEYNIGRTRSAATTPEEISQPAGEFVP